jgi:N-formylglutamate deformylase
VADPAVGGHQVLAGAPGSNVVLHVPHASTVVPPEIRAGLLLDDEELARELAMMTDAHTDLLAERAAATAAVRPWSFVNLLSRLVVDPERFPDEEQEVMSRVGMGAVYTATHDGRPLRRADPVAHRELLDRWFHPYAQGVTDLVDARLAAVGRVTIIDVHSYPRRRLPYEIGGDLRPVVCLGVDPAHTPDWLLAAGRDAFAGCGDIAVDSPFAGCYVPLKHYGKQPAVTALMVEIRRDRYQAEPGGPVDEGLALLGDSLAALIDSVERRRG